ncbi:MAG: hypothetical protein PHP42_03220 [Bacteroidota bacterium]|nr:hypothetical protein [Bacteroidota bacterium]
MNKLYGIILCLMMFAIQGLATEGEFNIYVRNNSQMKAVTIRLQKTQAYSWSWDDVNSKVISFPNSIWECNVVKLCFTKGFQ